MHDSLETSELHLLLDRIQQGDRHAENELIDRSEGRLRGLAQLMIRDFPVVGRWEQDDDVLQLAVMRLLSALREVRPPSTVEFFSFAARQIRRELIDLARRYRGPLNHAAHHDSNGAGDSSSHLPLDSAPDPETLRNLDRWTNFHEAIDSLPEVLRQVIEMRFYEGMILTEIARVLNRSERTIRNQMDDAVSRIVERLGDDIPEW